METTPTFTAVWGLGRGTQMTAAPRPDAPCRHRGRRVAVREGVAKSFDGYAGKTLVTCESGQIWLTQTGDGRDIVLKRGERFVCQHAGRVVVQGLRDAVLCLSE